MRAVVALDAVTGEGGKRAGVSTPLRNVLL